MRENLPTARKGKTQKRDLISFVAVQNKAIKMRLVYSCFDIARIDKMQQNSRCRLFGNRDETVYHIISECSKLAQRRVKD